MTVKVPTQGRPNTGQLTPEEFEQRYNAADPPDVKPPHTPRIFFTGKYSLRPQPPKHLCDCGCGQETAVGHNRKRNRYILHHFARSKSPGYPDIHVRRAVAIVEIDRWVAARWNAPPLTERSMNVALFRLGKKTGMTRDELKVLIERARQKFAANAERYVQAHVESVEHSLAIGTAAGNAVAQKGAEWAMDRIAADGARVLDAPRSGPAGKTIQIGISVGGISAGQPVATVSHQRVIEATPVSPDNRVLGRSLEAKVQHLLTQVTKDNAHEKTREIIDLGLSARAAWELVKEMIEVDERETKRGEEAQ